METQLEFEKKPFWIMKVLLFGGHDWSSSTIIFNKHRFRVLSGKLELGTMSVPLESEGHQFYFA